MFFFLRKYEFNLRNDTYMKWINFVMKSNSDNYINLNFITFNKINILYEGDDIKDYL